MMASSSIDFRVESRIPEFLKKFDSEIKVRLTESGNFVRNYILTNKLAGEGGGKIVKVKGSNTYYRQSIPGKPPATQLSHLRRSISVNKKGFNTTNKSVRVGSNLDYALYLERPKRVSLKRPFMENSFVETKVNVINIVSRKYFF